MKATKFIAVGALALTSAAFADGITSDIVGYKQNDLQHGQTYLAPCFTDVGGNGVDLTKLALGGSYTSGQISISVLNSSGRDIETYTYRKERSSDVWYWKASTTGAVVAEGDVVFEEGMGIAVTGEDGFSVTTAGAVSTKKDHNIPLCHGQTYTGNFTAVPLDLTAIIPGGEYKTGAIAISVLNSSGRDIATYTFRKARSSDVWSWYNGSVVVAEGEVIFEPGQGFAVTGEDGLSINIPGPEL